jgi:hypothetical protein
MTADVSILPALHGDGTVRENVFVVFADTTPVCTLARVSGSESWVIVKVGEAHRYQVAPSELAARSLAMDIAGRAMPQT